MSVSKENLEERLSCYMDGELAADERLEIETILRTDAEATAMLAKMRQLSELVKRLDHQTATSLPADFANRTVDAAISAAIDENSEDSPLLNLASQPATRTGELTGPRSNVTSRAIVGFLAVAAAIAVAIFAIPRQKSDIKIAGTNEIISDPDGTNPEPTATLAIDGAPETSQSIIDPTTALAANDPQSAEPLQRIESVADALDPVTKNPVASMSRDMIASTDTASDSISGGVDVRPPLSRNLPSEINPMVALDVPANLTPQTESVLKSMVMVIRVQQADPSGDAFAEAMERASLSELNKERLTPDLVAAVQNSAADDVRSTTKGELIFLRAPAKQIDKLSFELLDDVDGVQAISFGLVMDAPVRRLVDSVSAVNPTSVRHDSAVQIDATPEAMDAIRNRLASTRYHAVSADNAAAMTSMMGGQANVGTAKDGSGNDVISNVLIWLE